MSNTQSVNNQTNPTGNTGSSQGIQSIFDMEAIITTMMQEYMEENSSASKTQGSMGDLVEDSLENTYNQMNEELKKEEDSKPKHWYDKVGDFFKGTGEILGHLVAAAAEAAVGDISGAKSQWEDVETNPELENLIKALTYVVAAVTIVAGCVTGNFELVAVTAILLAVTQSGLLGKIEDHIGSSGGKLAFDIAVIVIATIATAGTGALETVADTAGEEAGEELTNLASKEGEQAAEKVTQVNVGKAVSSGLMGFGATLGSVNLSQDLVGVFDPNGKNKDKIEEILEIIQDVAAVVSAVAGGVGSIAAAGSDATGALSEKMSQLLTKVVPEELMQNASSFVENNMTTLTTLLQGGELVGNAAAAVLGGASATNAFRIAGIQKEVGKLQGALEKLTNALQENTDNIKANDQSFQNNLQSFSQMIGNFDHYFDGYAAQAQELLS